MLIHHFPERLFTWPGIRTQEGTREGFRASLRPPCARLSHAAGGEPEQIRFLLWHVSIQTTERYLGKQRIRSAVADFMLPRGRVADNTANAGRFRAAAQSNRRVLTALMTGEFR
jgi:hypothetical protein